MITFLFILAAILLFAMVYFGTLDAHVMPWTCPSCSHAGDENLAGELRHWYTAKGDRVRCRQCGTYFKEHPNGSLVEDR
jgi:hypothetical protein